jgi:hypothetical protein
MFKGGKMRKRIDGGIGAAAALLVCVAWLSDAQATPTSIRTFVSGTGTDAGMCSRVAPCRSFAYALLQTVAGGEITVLDPGGYGAVTINESVSIVNDGVGEAGVTVSSGNAITISTGSSAVVNLRGLTLVGLPGSGEGILFNATGTLNVQNCVIGGFGGDGMGLEPTGPATFNVADTVVSNAVGDGVAVETNGAGTVNATFTRVQALGDAAGFLVNGANSTGAVNATIANSTTSNNSFGVTVEGNSGAAVTQVMVSGTVINNNGTAIFEDGANSTTYLTKDAIAGNTTAFDILNSGAVSSFGDNDVKSNGNDGGALPLVSAK